MNIFNEILKKYIQSEASKLLEKSGGTNRLLLKGLPFTVADDFISYIKKDNPMIINDRVVPTFLFDKNIPEGKEPENTEIAGICGKDYVLYLRNSVHIKEIIIILSEGSSLDKSNITSFEPFGISEKVKEYEWGAHPMVKALLIQSVENGSLMDICMKDIPSILNRFNSGNFSREDHSDQWNLIKYISSIDGKLTMQKLRSIFGVINDQNEEVFKHAKCDLIFKKIADSFEDYGIKNSISEWKDQSVKDEVKDALGEFQNHFIRSCELPQYFSQNPYYYYSELSRNGNSGQWWKVLDVKTWLDILGNGKENNVDFDVQIANEIYPSSKNNPSPIVIDEADFVFHNKQGFPNDITLQVYEGDKKSGSHLLPRGAKRTSYKIQPGYHNSPVSFRFETDSSEVSKKLISLATYEPGFVFDIPDLVKAKKLSKNKNGGWKSNVTVSNSGNQEIEFYFAKSNLIFQKCTINHDKDSKEIPLPVKIDEGRGVLNFELLSSECKLKLYFVSREDSTDHLIELYVNVKESDPRGVDNVFQKLLYKNRSSKGILTNLFVNPPQWNVLDHIQNSIIKKDKSFYPIIVGSDLNEVSIKKLTSDDLLTNGKVINDCRPAKKDFTPPKELLEIRENIIEIILKRHGNSDPEFNILIEQCELFQNSIKNDLHRLIEQYLEEYQKWYKESPDLASWFDVVAICEVTDDVIDSEPYAIILTPYHPVRIAWLFQSQNFMYECLKKKIPCPAAGILESPKFPDCYPLSVFRPHGQSKQEVFLSVDNNSDYWNILWKGSVLKDLQSPKLAGIFNDNFGIEIEGLVGGLSSSQVERTLTDIFKIKSAQNKIKVNVHSESTETQLFNEGVENWVHKNLGDSGKIRGRNEKDIWFSSGGRELRINDTRSLNLQPSSEELLDTTIDSGYTLTWYKNNIKSKERNSDISIVSHLSNLSPILLNSKPSSVIFNGGVCRQRIRHSSVSSSGDLNFIESRSFSDSEPRNESDSLSKKLVLLLNIIESKASDLQGGHLSSTPKLAFIEKQLNVSDYCAISSNVVDPSAFFSSNGETYIWDYDLPSYSSKHSAQNGFYLLAKNSKTVSEAVKKSLEAMPKMEKINGELTAELLQEISGRGIPTLKSLASGGTSANGEIGMLVAMRLLQNLNSNDDYFEFLPFKKSDTYNILIPVDPYTSQLNTLSQRLKIDKLRPDLLSLSFQIKDGKINCAKVTPIEVKYRSNKMERKDLKTAHYQCHNFHQFYNKLLERSNESTLWELTRIRLLTDMISFAFSIYGKKMKGDEEKLEWSTIERALLNSLNDPTTLKVADQGRLIVLSNYTITTLDRISSTTIDDTLLLSFNDAKNLLLKQNLGDFKVLGKKVGNWGLICDCNDRVSPKRTMGTSNADLTVGKVKEETKEPVQHEPDPDPDPKERELEEAKFTPENLDDELNTGIQFKVGYQEGVFKELGYNYYPSNTNLNQLNVGVVGDLGTGKTQLIKALVYNICRYPERNRGEAPKFLIMDTKRDYDGSGDKKSDKNFVDNINAKVVQPVNLPINLFDIKNSLDGNPAVSKAEFFIDILKKIFGGIGGNQEHNILKAVLGAFEDKGYQPYSLSYQSFVSPTLKDILDKYEEIIGDKKDVPFAIMYKLSLNRYFEPDAEKTIDFKDFFNQSVVLSLGNLASNDKNLKMVMIIFLNMYRDYMLGVKKSRYIQKDNYQLRKIDSYLLIDEANLVMEYELPVLQDILLKGREFGVGVILSSQYLRHFRKTGTNYMEPLLTWFIHKVPNITVKELEALGMNEISKSLVSEIKSLQCHYCLYKSLDSNGGQVNEIIKGIPYYILDNEDALNK